MKPLSAAFLALFLFASNAFAAVNEANVTHFVFAIIAGKNWTSTQDYEIDKRCQITSVYKTLAELPNEDIREGIIRLEKMYTLRDKPDKLMDVRLKLFAFNRMVFAIPHQDYAAVNLKYTWTIRPLSESRGTDLSLHDPAWPIAQDADGKFYIFGSLGDAQWTKYDPLKDFDELAKQYPRRYAQSASSEVAENSPFIEIQNTGARDHYIPDVLITSNEALAKYYQYDSIIHPYVVSRETYNSIVAFFSQEARKVPAHPSPKQPDQAFGCYEISEQTHADHKKTLCIDASRVDSNMVLRDFRKFLEGKKVDPDLLTDIEYLVSYTGKRPPWADDSVPVPHS